MSPIPQLTPHIVVALRIHSRVAYYRCIIIVIVEITNRHIVASLISW